MFLPPFLSWSCLIKLPTTLSRGIGSALVCPPSPSHTYHITVNKRARQPVSAKHGLNNTSKTKLPLVPKINKLLSPYNLPRGPTTAPLPAQKIVLLTDLSDTGLQNHSSPSPYHFSKISESCWNQCLSIQKPTDNQALSTYNRSIKEFHSLVSLSPT